MELDNLLQIRNGVCVFASINSLTVISLQCYVSSLYPFYYNQTFEKWYLQIIFWSKAFGEKSLFTKPEIYYVAHSQIHLLFSPKYIS